MKWSALLLAAAAYAQTGPVTVTIAPRAASSITVPLDFVGLSFETGSLTSATAFPANSAQLQSMVSQLGPGWLRFGGNSVDKTAWARGARTASSPSTTLLSSDVDRVIAFAHATGWRVLWALNQESSTPATAADEADYVFETTGGVLAGFEIGNEPDLYSGNTLANLEANWKAFADAIQNLHPNAILTGPADASNVSAWTSPFAALFASRLSLVTQHYYPLGPPPTVPATQPNSASVPNLLSTTTQNNENSEGSALNAIAAKTSLPWRMAETNSCYNGGYDGVSNVFAAALWGLDYMFRLASNAAAGVNFHGGGTGLYTPLAVSTTNNVTTVTARPLYYALLAFGAAEGARVVPLTVNAGKVNLSAYAVMDPAGALRVFIINQDQQNDAAVQITPPGYSIAAALRLSAPSLTEKTAMTLGGASVAADGSWSPNTLETVPGSGGVFALTVPVGSAAIVGFGATSLGIGNSASGKSAVAPLSMASAYGNNLGFVARSTPTVNLPTSLAGVSATIQDAAGVSRALPLIYVSPSQVNFVVPQGVAAGMAKVTIGGAGGTIQVAPVAPGLFGLSGTAVAAATAGRYSLTGADQGAVTVFNCAGGACQPVPISLDSQSNVYLALYGTGLRGEAKLANITCTVGGVSVPVLYAGPQAQYTGFDQVNLQLPLSLRGAGIVNVVVTVDDQPSNAVQIAIE